MWGAARLATVDGVTGRVDVAVFSGNKDMPVDLPPSYAGFMGACARLRVAGCDRNRMPLVWVDMESPSLVVERNWPLANRDQRLNPVIGHLSNLYREVSHDPRNAEWQAARRKNGGKPNVEGKRRKGPVVAERGFHAEASQGVLSFMGKAAAAVTGVGGGSKKPRRSPRRRGLEQGALLFQ